MTFFINLNLITNVVLVWFFGETHIWPPIEMSEVLKMLIRSSQVVQI